MEALDEPLTLQCCDTRVCSTCVCKHAFDKTAPLCPFCRGRYVSGHGNFLVVAFYRRVCSACNISTSGLTNTCTWRSCPNYQKESCLGVKKRFCWTFTYEKLPGELGDGITVRLNEDALFSYRSGPTAHSSRYVLRPDGNIEHVHDDGKVQAWFADVPKWYPLTASSLAIAPARRPQQ